MTNELPREIYVNNDIDGFTAYEEYDEEWMAFHPHKYILASRVEKMIRLAVLEERRIQTRAYSVSSISEFFNDEINQLREELQ